MRLGRIGGLVAFGASLVGCYTLQPTGGVTPPAGTQMAFDVTDVGRVALGGSMGPEISQIEGRLIEAQNGEYVVSVSAVRLLRGGEQIWTGERVRIDKQHVGRVYERRFSRGRTLALGAVAVAGAAALIAARNPDFFTGRGDDHDRPIEPIPDFMPRTRVRVWP